MDIGTSDPAAVATRPRLYGIVQTYIQKQLPRHIHPAFKALRDREEAAITSPQIIVTEDTTLPLQREPGSRSDQIGTEKDEKEEEDEDDDLRLYVAPQSLSFFMADVA